MAKTKHSHPHPTVPSRPPVERPLARPESPREERPAVHRPAVPQPLRRDLVVRLIEYLEQDQ